MTVAIEPADRQARGKSTTFSVLAFTVDQASYAIASDCVVECLSAGASRPVPAAKPQVVGFVAFRDAALPLIDLGVIESGGAQAPRRSYPKWIVCEHGPGHRCAIGVTSLQGIHRVESSQVSTKELPGDRISAVSSSWVPCLGKRLPLLSPPELFCRPAAGGTGRDAISTRPAPNQE